MEKEIIYDHVVGALVWEKFYWAKTENLVFRSRDIELKVIFEAFDENGDFGGPISEVQKKNFLNARNDLHALFAKAEAALALKYGDAFDQINKIQWHTLFFSDQEGKGYGLLGESDLNSADGIGVRFYGDQVEVGGQNILF